MNKTIYNIARQADRLARVIEPDLREVVRYNRIRDEKFAELIVRECADVVSNQYSADWGKWSNRMILEHFGVEE